MNEKITEIILAWHDTYVALGNCIESARVVLDQSDRGTLLPDRVREMRGELLATQEKMPRLADLLEEITDTTVWPMKAEDESPVADPIVDEPDAEVAAEPTTSEILEPAVTGEGDYDAEGATPTEAAPVDEEAAAETEPVVEEPFGEATPEDEV